MSSFSEEPRFEQVNPEPCGCAETRLPQKPQPHAQKQGTPYTPRINVDQPTGVPMQPTPAPGGQVPYYAPAEEEGKGPEGPRSRCGPRIGHVALAGEDFIKVQNAVDKGQNQWRLDPVQTARVVGTSKLGFANTDRFWLKGRYVDAGSGLHHALVNATHQTCVYLIELYQPVKQGPGGIWAVERVDELETRTIR